MACPCTSCPYQLKHNFNILQPTVVLSHLSRSANSIEEHGQNQAVYWSPDASRLVIQVSRLPRPALFRGPLKHLHQTDKSHILLVSIQYARQFGRTPYDASRLARAARRFHPGPGEGVPLEEIALELEGVVAIDGSIQKFVPNSSLDCIALTYSCPDNSVLLRESHILFSTADPPAVQRIAWPSQEQEEEIKSPLSPTGSGQDDGWALRLSRMSWLPEAGPCA